MASEIKVDTIVNAGGDNDTGIDLATNDQILLKVANATKLTMNATGQTTIVGEGGTNTTSVQQGLCKGFLLQQNKTSNTTHHSLNVTSVTDLGTGEIRVAHTQNMSSGDETIVVGGVAAGVFNGTCMMPSDNGADDEYQTSTSQYEVTIRGNDNVGQLDCLRIPICIFGDLA